LSREKAEGFYAVHKERPFYNDLVDFMTSGPCMPMALEKEDAVNSFRSLIGATNPADAEAGTIRKDFAENIQNNAVHGSDSDKNAQKEIAYFYTSNEILDY
jgi:nucleoside-diphosphate kinase